MIERLCVKVFDRFAPEYDRWFEDFKHVYISELEALKKAVKSGKSIEIGSGTGRFALPLGIRVGVEPSLKMAEISKDRGLEVIRGVAEYLPLKSSCFDFILMVTLLCFLDDTVKALRETRRILRSGGRAVIGIIDGESFLGKYYREKGGRIFDKAEFKTPEEVIEWLESLGFVNIRTFQTIFDLPEKINRVQKIEEGYGMGGFVVITADRP